jgi:arginine deiminase
MGKLSIKSEIGKLKKVIIHEPGSEIEIMTPKTSEDLLYDDILDLKTAVHEHRELAGILKIHANVYQIKDLLRDVLDKVNEREELLKQLIDEMNASQHILDDLMPLDSTTLANLLICGVEKKKDTLTRFLSPRKYSLPPLPNFVYTRDSAIIINESVLTGSMANLIRSAEATIMRYIFAHHDDFLSDGFYFDKVNGFHHNSKFEGGDILVIREDVLAIGLSERTTSEAIDQLTEKFREKGQIKHIFAVILPKERAMIHLDMIFTMVDSHYCVVHEPVILGEDKLGVVHIDMTEKVNKITMVTDLLSGLKKVGIDLISVLCGGKERLRQEREQWMCGANYFTIAPGKVIGYGRNTHTFDELEKVANMPRFEAVDILKGKIDISKYDRYAIAISGAELSRGGGGARCMTMPIQREYVDLSS